MPASRAQKRQTGPVNIEGSVVLVTGANRGLGRAFALELRERGARTVYAGARDPGKVGDRALVPVRLDVTDAGQVAAAAERCADATLLVNNAGVMRGRPLLAAPSMDDARVEMATNYFGTLAMCRAFAPVLGRNGGGAIVNMLSVVSFFAPPWNASYAASKSAAWSLTNGIRTELRQQGTLVVAVHAGFIDTEMAADVTMPKIAPEDVARQMADAVEGDREEVLADQRTRDIKAALPRDLELIYPALRQQWGLSD
jgi:NAD(P)-dependent dehydrogenase (short-subunit alcohol dehydrogenase family)